MSLAISRWTGNQVQSVESTATYHIVMNNGRRMEGKIGKKSGEKSEGEDFLIREATEDLRIPSAAVVSIEKQAGQFQIRS